MSEAKPPPPVLVRQANVFSSNSQANGPFKPSPRGSPLSSNVSTPPAPKIQGAIRAFGESPRFPKPETVKSGSPGNERPSPAALFPRTPGPGRVISSDGGELLDSPVKSKAEEFRQNLMLMQQVNRGSPDGPRETPRPAAPSPALVPPLRSQKSVTETPAPLRKPLPPETTLGSKPIKPKRPPLVNLDNFRKGKLPQLPGRLPVGKMIVASKPPHPGFNTPPAPLRPGLRPSPSMPQRPPVPAEEEQDTYDDVDFVPPFPAPPPLPAKQDSWNNQGSNQGDEDSDGSEIYEEVDSTETQHHKAGDNKKRQKELKRQQELDKKEMKERQKRESEFRKKFKLTGSVEVIHSAKVRVDCRGGKNDLYVKQGEIVEIVRVKNNPEGKWLARTFDGTYGYINNTSVDVDYEEVKRKIQSQGRSRVLESSSGPVQDEDFYDDVGSSEQMSSNRKADNEDVYDDVEAIPEEFPPPPPEICLDPRRSKKEEKEEKEFRKKFKYEGPIEVQYQMMVDPNANIKKTGGKDLPLIRGEILDVIKMVNDKKAICRNKQGKYGYVPKSILLQAEGDIYDDAETAADIYDND
ncbi:FYN-binding protein 1-like [Acipenser ruthenus]|uniref:FYN-binding protein 1-like n=1 Tax=Acipenser ruthenus TaxID=7906 RepID=UPI0027427E3E|nr:FYN-binding protein 1-like [Acipenser ruthenus]